MALLGLSILLFTYIAYVAASTLRRRKRQLPCPPGPPRDPFIGHLRTLPTENQAQVFRQWSKTYGNLVHVEALGWHVIILGDFQTANDLLDKRSINYSDRPRFPIIEIIDFLDLPFLRYGDEFRRQRKIAHSDLTKKACGEYMPLQRRNAHVLAFNLCNHPGRREDCLNAFSTGSVVSIVCGDLVQSVDDEWVKIVEHQCTVEHRLGRPGGSVLDILPSLQYFPSWFPGTGDATYARKSADQILRIFRLPIEKVQAQLAKGVTIPSIMASELSRLSQQNSTGEQDLISVCRAAGSLLHAGPDTTWRTLSTFILAMTLYPSIQHRAQSEIDEVIGGNRLPEFSDHDSLPYVSALIQEVFRWNPAVPLGLPHRAVDDDTYNGYFIPKGAVLLSNIFGMSRDESIYKDPDTFNPTRFLRRPAGREEPHFSDIVFGFGRRICPGRHFAYNSVWIAVVTCLATLNITKALDEAGQEMTPKGKFTMTFISRPGPYSCKIIPRSDEVLKLLRTSREEIPMSQQ